MSDSIFTLTIEGEAPREFSTREEAMTIVKARVEAANSAIPFTIKETSFCEDCGEEKRYSFMSYCEDCSFRLNPAVKASRKIIRALKLAGDPVVKVYDGEENVKGKERDLLEAVHSVDDSTLYTQSGAFIRIIGGNESECDCVADWSMSIDETMKTVHLND